LRDVAEEVVATLAEDGLPVNSDLCRLNVGVHWGGTLFIGQVSSEGRLEITALGDEMNEGARIEQLPPGAGTVTGIEIADRAAVRRRRVWHWALDTQAVSYEIIADIAGVSTKASATPVSSRSRAGVRV